MDGSSNPRVDAMKNSYMLEKEYEENDKHYQNALSLYEMILDNVEDLSKTMVKWKLFDEEYIDSARIGVMQAHLERLCAMLPDWQIEALKQRMKIVVDKE